MLSRIGISLASVGFLVAIASPVLAASGDVNNDGRVDNQDVQLIDDYLNGDATLQDDQIRAADADNDGRITANDKELLQRRLRGVAVKPTPQKNTRTSQGNTSNSQVDFNSANSGVVIDKATGQPLAGVRVSLPDEGVTVITDAQGRFQLPRSATGKILTAKASQYAPAAVTNQQGKNFELQLEKLSPRLQVIDDELHHLGDGNYSASSANASDFRLRNQGYRYMRIFTLSQLPQGDMSLRIGSLIGLDTHQARQAGQSGLNQNQQDGLKIFLNGQLINQIYLNGDNILVPLPRWLLRSGTNQLAIETPRRVIDSGMGFSDDGGGILGLLRGLGIGGMRMNNGIGAIDYDDIEFAHLVLEDPNGQVQGKFNSRGRVYQPNP
jgi:Dockerin type I domain/CarboxypepD_reg-like domain